MKKSFIAVTLLSLVIALPVCAAEGSPPPRPAGQTFEQRQANILQSLDQRLAALQEAKACVQGAKSDDDLRACRQKHMDEMRDKRGDRGPGRGMMGGPQGQ
ncbi:MAG TPA: hypothetical protein VK654_13670 [Nitrospirota bacterium]|nr:hypothetical protein [Nitrospirota bacterium]